MLLCGFDNFKNIFVRIDILERLFLMIFNSNKENQKEIRLVPDMLNLLGCNKESFLRLLENLKYKTFEKEKEIFFKYLPNKKVYKKNNKNIKNLDSPFSKLVEFNIK